MLLLFGLAHPARGQSDREVAERIVATLPASPQGWSAAAFSEAQFRHVQDHGALYVDVIREALSWPASERLLEDEDAIRLYGTLLPLLVTARGEASRHFMDEVFQAAARRYDRLQQSVDSQGNRAKSAILAEELFMPLADVMRLSIEGLRYSEDDRLLDEVMSRYDAIQESARSACVAYVRQFSPGNPKAEKWLQDRGLAPATR
ncbi:MAG: hypothetical protein R2834_19390 [Rhodothermales bacterium]